MLLNVNAEGETFAQPYSAGTNLIMAKRDHIYDDSVVDGGIYCLRNVHNGQYLDVDNEGTADWTHVSTYTYHGRPNQQFKILYMGKGLYEIVPIISGTRLHIQSDHELVIHAQNRGVEQKFRLQMVGSGVGVIYSQHSGFERALTWDQHNPQSVADRSYANLANKTHAQWVFERVDATTSDYYANFYIRNTAKNLYLDVHNEATAPGSVVHGFSFLSHPNQEWKLVSAEDGGCYFKTSIQRDMALDYRGSNLAIQPDNNPATQRFFLYFEDIEAGTGLGLYKIGMEADNGIQYLTMRTKPDYGTVHYYVEWSTDATDLWAFERVVVDAKDPRTLTLNTATSGSITSGYNELKYYTYRPTKTARYKIELSTANCFLETVVSSTGMGYEWDRYDYDGKLIVNIVLYENSVYYFPIRFSGVADGANGTFSIRVRQLTFVGHSRDDGDQNDKSRDINAIEDTLTEDLDFFFEHRRNMTKQQAQSSTCSLIGYRDFNAEIFIYSGHGSGGYACYDGNNEDGYVASSELPDMSNCELVVWDCCYSSVDNDAFWPWNRELSLVEASIEKGATTAIGWSTIIDGTDTLIYVSHLFYGLREGMSVIEASQAAVSSQNINQASAVVSNIFVSGARTNVIFPISQDNATVMTVEEQSPIYDSSEYTLWSENASLGAKLYVRLINGVVTDDYFLEFYDDNGNLTGSKKSDFTMTDADIVESQALWEQAISNSVATHSVEEFAEYQFRLINGEMMLILKVTQEAEDCTHCVQTAFYNAITGEEVLR